LLILLCVDRLTDDTFTLDEVNEMLDGLLSVVRSEVDNELDHTTHTNILLLLQLFQQAEKWHLKLQADISELENRFDIYFTVTVNTELKNCSGFKEIVFSD